MGELAALSAALVWAVASIIFTNLGRQRAHPLAMNMIKCALALSLMMLTLWALEGSVWPTHASMSALGALCVSGLIGLTLGDTAYFYALNHLGARRTLLLSTLGPPATALMAWPVLGEPITLRMLGGMALTLGGIAMVISERAPARADHDEAQARRALRAGLLLAALSVLCQATGNILTKLGAADLSPLSLGVVRLSAGVMGLGVVLSVLRRWASATALLRQPRQLGWLALATVLGTYLGIWLLMTGLKHTEAGVAATLSAMSPIFVIPLARLIHKEPLTARALGGAIIAVAGVAILMARASS